MRGVGMRPAILASGVLALGIAAGAIFLGRSKSDPSPPPNQPATAPASMPVTPVTQPKPAPISYMELVRAVHPNFPTTQPLELPLASLGDTARIRFDNPIHLDTAGQLWVTRSDSPTVSTLLQQAVARAEQKKKSASRRLKPASQPTEPEYDEQTHLTRDRVVFAYLTFNEMGEPQQQVVIRKREGGFELVNLDGRIDLGTPGRKYCWDRARWVPRDRDSAIVVPTDSGISIFRPQARPIELFQEMANSPAADRFAVATSPATTTPATQPTTSPRIAPANAPPQFLLDPRGLLAWIPPDNGKPGSSGAYRFVDGKWQHLDESKDWPLQIVHLVPLLDGSVLQIVTDETNLLSVRVGILDRASADLDEKQIVDLVAQLSNPDRDTREAAHAQLTRYGPQAWPALEKLQPDQPAEGRLRIEQLLSQKSQPMLGRLILQEGRGKIVARFADGGALLWAESGVVAPGVDPAEPGAVQAPAWIAIRANRPIELAPPAVVSDLDPDHASVDGFFDEWIVSDDVQGPQRLLGNHLESLLRKSEREEFRQLIGRDSRGRWLFRRANDPPAPDALPAGPTLIIDPWLPDPTPRLPAWRYPVENGTVGWTADNWPVVKSGGAWVLDKDGTRPLKPEEEMFSDMREMPDELVFKAYKPETTLSSTSAPTTAQTTGPTTGPAELPIGFDSEGGRYFDGKTELRRIDKQGRIIFWALPAEAVGAWPHPRIIEAEDRLFLFNEFG
ncbi:hypothetical protein BH09PLA1_BH09PLA1_14720 [soil metagenome]